MVINYNNMDQNFITITNNDIYAELKRQGKVQDEILEHNRYTNGKVAQALADIDGLKKEMPTKVSTRESVGYWIAHNPFKFAFIIVSLLTAITYDTRVAIIGIIKAFI